MGPRRASKANGGKAAAGVGERGWLSTWLGVLGPLPASSGRARAHRRRHVASTTVDGQQPPANGR